MHLKVQAIGMRIIAANVVKARPQLERALQGGFEPRELSARNERTEVVNSGFDLAACVDARESLLPIDLHQCEEAEGSHLSIRLREVLLPLAIQDVQSFE